MNRMNFLKNQMVPLCLEEPDECSGGSASDDSAYMGDCENTKGSRDDFAIVNLNFGTLSKFLSSHLKAATSTPSVGSQPKKRRYNNENRLRAAAAKKEEKQPARKRNPRNSLESHYSKENCVLVLFLFLSIVSLGCCCVLSFLYLELLFCKLHKLGHVLGFFSGCKLRNG